MKTTSITLLLAACLTGGGVIAQTAPVGGPDAKGNAPIKRAHTVNDGSAKPAANSFTQSQAMHHIEKSGYTGVSGLVKGSDGVWRGAAMKNGAPVNVAMDFKGNVTQGMTSAPMPMASSSGAMATSGDTASMPATGSTGMRHRHHHRHHHHHGGGGVARSGLDRNRNGISDKEDRALAHGHE